MTNNHPAFLPEESLRSEETRSRQVLVLPRFHVKHGKWRLHCTETVCATVSRRSGTSRCGSQAAIEECVWQEARSHDASRAASYG